MKLLLATLCDSAADYNGKLCILGAFDTLCASQFPVVHPQCSLAVRLLFTQKDAGRHQFDIQFMDDAGNAIIPSFPPDPHIDVTFPHSAIPFVTRNIVLNLQRLRFEHPGVFQFHITLDGDPIMTLPLRVTHLEELRATNAPAG
ncbi:MAG: DUF6941 family protein [Roseimicrobium sp.]